MAYPNGSEAREAPAAFANARITIEEAERLAAIFGPSWEIDLSPMPHATDGERTPEKAHVTNADVRSAIPALNGTHAPAPSSILRDAPWTAGPNGLRAEAPRAPVPAIDAVAPYPRAPKAAVAALDLQVAIRRPKVGLWVAIGGVAAVIAGALVFWLSSGSDKPAAMPPSAPTAKVESTNAALEIPPPPPLENLAPEPTQAATTVPPPAPPPRPAAAPAQSPSVPPSPPPVVVHAAPPPGPRATPNLPAAQPAPKAPHTKSSAATIVRDVPF